MGRGKIIFLPVEVAGYVAGVSQGLAEIGWQVSLVDLSGNPYGYGEVPAPPGALGLLGRVARRAGAAPVLTRAALRAAMIPMRVIAALVSVPRYDAVVCMYGASLAWGLDAWAARRRGVPVITVYLGSDSRPPFFDGASVNRPDVDLVRLLWRSWRTSRRVRWMSAHSSAVICHPPSAQYLTRPFVNWLAIGLPVPPRTPVEPPEWSGPVRILHAPSDRRVKGSDVIASAVAQLAADGASVELVEVSGVSNAAVLEQITRCHLVVDQLFSDTPLAGFACEAAALGRPVLTFGYAAPYLAEALGELGIPAEHYMEPEFLGPALVQALRDPGRLQQTAQRTQEFVHERWSSTEVARRVDRVIDGDVPEDWLCHPATVDYIWGCGMGKETLLSNLSRYVSKFGERALFLPRDGSAREQVIALLRSRPDG